MTQKNQKMAEQNDPNGPLLKSVKRNIMCGEVHTVSMYRPTIIVDSHMHIQSGRCATLPFIWYQLAGKPSLVVNRFLDVPRGWLEVSGIGLGYIMEKLYWLVGAKEKQHDGTYCPKTENPLGKLTKQSMMTTIGIGEAFIKESRKVVANYFKNDPLYKPLKNNKGIELILSSVVMTMDMEYAHVDGYYGLKIYNAIYKSRESYEKDEDPVGYWTPLHGTWQKIITPEWQQMDVWRIDRSRTMEQYKCVDNTVKPATPISNAEFKDFARNSARNNAIIGSYRDGNSQQNRYVKISAIPVLISKDETKKYEYWEKQLKYTELAALKYPLKMLPMFHYDPRRWNISGNMVPFSRVQGEHMDAIYLGFKIYTAQGYRPWDPRLPILKEFYAKCCELHIPIMNHCTPGGARTVEIEQYWDFYHVTDDEKKERTAKLHTRNAENYFDAQFVSPEAWKEVLDRTVTLTDTKGSRKVALNKLHLCLAHFGGPTKKGLLWNQHIIEMISTGGYPNLYTDISSSFASEKFRNHFKSLFTSGHYSKNTLNHLKKRIIFGTDWYMIFKYGIDTGMDFLKYCRATKEWLDSFDTSLWPAFSMYNPYKFYRLDKQVGRIADNIIEKRDKDPKVKKILGEIKPKTISKIKRDAAWIREANNGHVIYKETS